MLLLASLKRASFGALSQDLTDFSEGMLRLAANSLVDLRSHRFLLPDSVSQRPAASPMARLQAQAGTPVTTMLHTHVEIPDQDTRRLLQLLDGSHDISAMARNLRHESPAISRQGLEEQVIRMLEAFRKMGLLLS